MQNLMISGPTWALGNRLGLFEPALSMTSLDKLFKGVQVLHRGNIMPAFFLSFLKKSEFDQIWFHHFKEINTHLWVKKFLQKFFEILFI